MSDEPSQRRPKLNLFAVPSQTTLLFIVILVVVGYPILMSGSSRSFLLLPILPIMVFAFTLWDFLSGPDRDIARLGMKPLLMAEEGASSSFGAQTPNADAAKMTRVDQGVFDHVIRLAAELGLANAPQLLVIQDAKSPPFAFGTWHRHYLALPQWLIKDLNSLVTEPDGQSAEIVDTILRHELAHFANQDVWLTHITRSLLKISILVLLVHWFAFLWIPFYYTSLQAQVTDWRALIPSELMAVVPPDIQGFLAAPPALTPVDIVVALLMVSMAMLPLVFGAFFLWAREWRLMLRVRELYCDSRVANWQHSVPKVAMVALWIEQVIHMEIQANMAAGGHLRPLAGWLRWPLDIPFGSILQLRMYPKLGERTAALERPHVVYGEPNAIAMRAGVAVILLYFVLASLFAPAQTGIGSEQVLGFGFLILALGMLPGHLVAMPAWRKVLIRVRTALLRFVLLIGIVLGTMIAITMVAVLTIPGSLDLTLYAIAMVAPGELTSVVGEPMEYIMQVAVGALITFGIALPLVVGGFLLLHIAIIRRALQWYGAPFWKRRSRSVFLLFTIAMALLLWHGVLPLINAVAFPAFFPLDIAFLNRVGLAWLIAFSFGLLFWLLDSRYWRRCPICNERVGDEFELGLYCPHCGEVLSPWLLAAY